MTYAHERTPTEWHTEYIQQHKHNLTMCRCTQWQLISTIVQSIVKDTLTQCSCTHLITRRFQIWAGYMDDFKIPLCQILTATFYVTSNLCDSNNAYLSTHTVYQYKIQFFHYLGGCLAILENGYRKSQFSWDFVVLNWAKRLKPR